MEPESKLEIPDEVMTHSADVELSVSERAILRTVLYSSLFDYPLTLRELQQNLLELKMDCDSILEVYRSSPALQRMIECREGFIFPLGREGLVRKRRLRELRSRSILGRHSWILKLIGAIPYTRVVAISGSAAHLNVDSGGDIDLFIVTKGRRVWSVAVTILLLTKLVGQRKIVCFNFIVSDDCLVIARQDLFNASQIVHLKPLIGEDVYRKFVKLNPFVSEFYPNFEFTPNSFGYGPGPMLRALKHTAEWIMRFGPAQIQELVCRRSYSWYLRRKSSTWTSPQEVFLGRDYLKLHTESHRTAVTERFEDNYRKAVGRAGEESGGNTL